MKIPGKQKPTIRQQSPSYALESRIEAHKSPELCCVIGEQLLQEGRPQAALDLFRKAVELDSGSTRGWFGHGMTFTQMSEYAKSCEYFSKAIKLDPSLAIAHHNLGRSLHEIGEADLAYKSFQKALSLGFEATRKNVAIFAPGCPSASNQTVLLERKTWADKLSEVEDVSHEIHLAEISKDKKLLKIGYVSAFFHKRNWMKPVWGLIDEHNRERFQIHLFSDRMKSSPAIRQKLEPGDQFHDMSDLSDVEAAELIAGFKIDILVDLNGYSYPKRFPVFLHKPAPLIVGWFNMYATTGFNCFDYLIGDKCVIPPSEEVYYTEKIARVTGSYLTFSVGYDVPDVTDPPCIENQFVTFGSLISQYKITPGVIDAWCRILAESPDSHLLLRNVFLEKKSNRKYVRSLFAKRGIADERIFLEGPAPHFEFLQTYSRIDIALDAFPYNGGTTTTEAIWQGLPVVSYWGDRWVSRTSATLLRSAGLQEMVADDVSAYVSLATSLANDPDRLMTMRRGMRDKLLAAEVCNTSFFAGSMENLYREFWDNQTGLPANET